MESHSVFRTQLSPFDNEAPYRSPGFSSVDLREG